MGKITLLSPVHISTGDMIEFPCYYAFPGYPVCYRYKFEDILLQLPYNALTDTNLLNHLSNKQSSKKELYSTIKKYVNYKNLRPLYQLTGEMSSQMQKKQYDFSEQIKDLDKPYIPGSSVKGALWNAWMYWIIKSNLEAFQRHLAKNLEKMKNRRLKDPTLFDLLYDDGDRNLQEFTKALRSCLLCPDIYFEKLGLYICNRYKEESSASKFVAPGYCEAINPRQTVQTTLFTIDEERLRHLIEDEKYRSNEKAKWLVRCFKERVIYNGCNAFIKDMLEIEQSEQMINFYDDFPGVNEQLGRLKAEMNKADDAKNKQCMLRIGKSTNYFTKSISYLVKKNAPELFEEYFDSVFSPSLSRKTKPEYDTIPKTRVIFDDLEQYYLPGFIKVEYD